MPRPPSSSGRGAMSSVLKSSRRSRRGSLGGYPESFTCCCFRRRAGELFSMRAWSTGSPNRCRGRRARCSKACVRNSRPEAQRWYLTALASDPRNVEALTGLAITCQHLVSNPWWAEPRVVATASDLGREAAAIALSIAPGHSAAHCVQGMLHSAGGQLAEAAGAFERALATDSGQGTAHGFSGYNAAFLGRAEETVPAVERAMILDRSDLRHSIWL